MIQLKDIVELQSGTPQFRIMESSCSAASLYIYYDQNCLVQDLSGAGDNKSISKTVRTADAVSTLQEGDVIFSLISGKAAIVKKDHQGYLYSQNYVKLIPSAELESSYLVYLLNEDKRIKQQCFREVQGSATMKYTIRLLSNLILLDLPSPDLQSVIGDLYLNTLRLAQLKKEVADSETAWVLGKIKEISKNE